MSNKPVKRALIGVSDKTGIVEFAGQLQQLGVEILSTGGTYKALQEAGVQVQQVSDYTGFPEIMDGRVKTLHPRIHGGILARREQDAAVMNEHGIQSIDLVVVNLYPFREAITARPDDLQNAMGNVDIGGPAMLRAAAKNHAEVGVVVNPEDYARIVQELTEHQGLRDDTRYELATRAFAHTASYDSAIADYLAQEHDSPAVPAGYQLAHRLRYGENPHQNAALYTDGSGTGVAGAEQIQGKQLSYNNLADADTAIACANAFSEEACVIVKHANPSSVALRKNQAESYQCAFESDPTSAFGGIIAFNRLLSGEVLEKILQQQFVEVIIAPDYDDDCIAIAKKKKNVRLLKCNRTDPNPHTLRSISGGLLTQERDLGGVTKKDLQTVTKRAPANEEIQDLMFAWTVARFVKSNAIVYARNCRTLGVGAGQMSRLYSARIASLKAEAEGLKVVGSAMASDAFFPFRDGIDAAAEAGIKAIIQPGGSIRDEEIIEAANEADIAMVFTGKRHFLH